MTGHEEIAKTVTDAEAQILKELWQESPLNSQEIIERLEKKSNSHHKTVRTLINRLLTKGAINFNEKNRKYYYYPVLEKEKFYKFKADAFLQQLFNGQLTPLISFFSNNKKLNNAEIAELKALIKKMEEKDGN